MLKTFTIENYKSIERMKLDLGRVNVLIGENGAGKSNILEAIALAGAAQAGKLDNEFLASRGIRAVAPNLMRSAFEEEKKPDILLSTRDLKGAGETYTLKNNDKPYSSWTSEVVRDGNGDDYSGINFEQVVQSSLDAIPVERRAETIRVIFDYFNDVIGKPESSPNKPKRISVNGPPEVAEFLFSVFPRLANIADFVVYSPENSALRVFEHESQIAPLGIHGEGLLKLLTVMDQAENRTPIDQIKSALCMLGWFHDYTIVQDKAPRMDITDRFLSAGTVFDQRSANEGFLYIAFYFALFCSDLTPKLFAVDNIDASLNPKLCRAMVEQLTEMAKRNDKQVILTTHNPAVLDGLDLNDDEQRLFVIERDADGRTQAFRQRKPKYDGKPRKLSELFMAGAIGGLPTEF